MTHQTRVAQRAGRTKATRGFTLVEILVVVVILGVLAAIVVPQFTSAAGESRDSSLKMDLYRIRQQIQVYRQQHDGMFPSLDEFEAQMTTASNKQGTTAAIGTAGYNLGPYLREVPVNPHTSTNNITAGGYGDSAWYYDEADGTFRANDTEEHAAY